MVNLKDKDVIEGLLRPRYKVIADYPKSIFKVGEILHVGSMGDLLYCDTNGPRMSQYPHLFKPLQWWEERKLEELLSISQEWRPISGYEGYYEVSNLGLIKSLARLVTRKHNGETEYTADRKERLLALNLRKKDGYVKICLSKDDIVRTFYVHLLVADAFLPPIDGKDYINHIDNNRGNPMLSNLERCTQSENLLHSVRTNNYCEKIKNRKKANPTQQQYLDYLTQQNKP